MSTLFSANSNADTAAAFLRPGDIQPSLAHNVINVSASGATAAYNYSIAAPTAPTIIVFDAANIAYAATLTLPAPTTNLIGATIKVIIKAAAGTSGDKVTKITTGLSTVFLRGGIIVSGGTSKIYVANTAYSGTAASNTKAIVSNGTDEQAGIMAGSTFEFTCISSTEWYVTGTCIVTGATAASPFSTTA